VPTGRQHRKFTRSFLGYDLPAVHAYMDHPRAIALLQGDHRRHGHDRKALRVITRLFGERGRAVYAVHYLQDAGVLPATVATVGHTEEVGRRNLPTKPKPAAGT
jgi:hypothetical protein